MKEENDLYSHKHPNMKQIRALLSMKAMFYDKLHTTLLSRAHETLERLVEKGALMRCDDGESYKVPKVPED